MKKEPSGCLRLLSASCLVISYQKGAIVCVCVCVCVLSGSLHAGETKRRDKKRT